MNSPETGKKKKWRYALLAALLAVFLSGSFLWKEKHAEKPAAADHIPLVRTTAVTVSGASPAYTYPGEVCGRYESQLAFQVGGKIIKRNVETGEAVQAGQALLQLDPKDIRQETNSYSAQLTAAQARLKLARSDLSRYQQLYDQAAVSQAQLDQYVSAYDVALAAVRQAEAQYAQGSHQLDYTLLYADQPGVIAAIDAEAGQVVSAGQTVVTLVRDGEREIEVSVPENRLEELRQAAGLQVRFWALPRLMVEGRLREIAPAASPVTRTYRVRIALTDPPPEVKLGMTAAVTAVAPGRGAAGVVIPLSALYQTGDSPGVWVVKENSVSLRPVSVGLGGNDTIELLSGLQPGEIIVTAGVHKLREGQKIQPYGGEQP